MAGISIEQYRAAVGIHHSVCKKGRFMSNLFFGGFIVPNILFYNIYFPGLLLRCGDIESNPGPTNLISKIISMGHANVRSITSMVQVGADQSDKLCKFELVKAHILNHEYDVFGISETWLDSSVDVDLNIPGYHQPLRKDFNRHQRGIMVYISQSLPARRREDLEPPNTEIICVEVQANKQKFLICNCYRVPYYSIIDFGNDINSIIENALPEFQDIFILGDMNARNSGFWP